jgi:hypothetical protein
VDRDRVRRVLEERWSSRSVMRSFELCGRFATVQEAQDGSKRYRVRSMRCKNRFCPACGVERARMVAQAVGAKCAGDLVRFVTLTVRHKDEPLNVLLKKLLDSFKRLRRTPEWMRAVKGGIGFVEVKYGTGWHPHLHLLVTGWYLPHEELSRAWLRCTKDSTIVDIRAVKDRKEVVYYVAKYAGKPLAHEVVREHDRLTEVIEVLSKRKLVFTFGAWRGWRVKDEEKKCTWVDVAPLHVVMDRAELGDPEALRILDSIRNHGLTAMADEACRSPPTDECAIA